MLARSRRNWLRDHAGVLWREVISGRLSSRYSRHGGINHASALTMTAYGMALMLFWPDEYFAMAAHQISVFLSASYKGVWSSKRQVVPAISPLARVGERG